MSIIFGPVPSRRLGRSLGVNNIPPKICSYSCVYCQVGATDSMTVDRANFYSPDEVKKELSEHIEKIIQSGNSIDYITFVPDGEPTLDINLGEIIRSIKSLGIKIAVISNSSLIWDDAVKDDLLEADWVSFKFDSVIHEIWKTINRPHGSLDLNKIIEGVYKFASMFKGILATETMLIKGMNDGTNSITETAKVIKSFNPNVSYILVPTRPTALSNIYPPDESSINNAYQIYSDSLIKVELIMQNEGTDFNFSSDAEKEILSILAVHPMRKDAVEKFLIKSNSSWSLIEGLIGNKLIKETEYNNNLFFVKNLSRRTK